MCAQEFDKKGGVKFSNYEILYVGFVLSMAVLMDMYCDRISNYIIMTGFAGVFFKALLIIINDGFDLSHVLLVCTGLFLPFLLFLPLFYFHMIGAGDIKLMMVAGGMLGGKEILYCIFLSFVIAAFISVYKMIKYHLFRERFAYFSYYVKSYLSTKERKFYYDKELSYKCKVHFSVPLALSVLLVYIKNCVG